MEKIQGGIEFDINRKIKYCPMCGGDLCDEDIISECLP